MRDRNSNARILIECKDYNIKVGLNVLRSMLGLRADINNFNIEDLRKQIQDFCKKKSEV